MVYNRTFIMRILLEKEAYARFKDEAKAKGMSTRQLGEQILNQFLQIVKK